MIRADAELHGETSFREWASLFSGDIFVMIVIYADESGTHNPLGELVGSQFPIIAGYAAKKSIWDKFLVDWKAVLDKYEVKYFHGRELSAARVAAIQKKPETKELLKNPYYAAGWDVKKIDAFHDKLTKVAAAANKIPIVASISIPLFNEKVKSQVSDKDPYRYLMSEFFLLYHEKTHHRWGNFKEDVQFFFDQNNNKEWVNSIHEVFSAFQKKDTRMSGPNFADKKKHPYWPLQAADLLAYRARQHMDDASKNKLFVTQRDKVMIKNLTRRAAKDNPSIVHLLK